MPSKRQKPPLGSTGNNGKSQTGRDGNGRFAEGNSHGFQPGHSGNPQGRPRDTITPHLRELVQRLHPDAGEITYGELIALRLIEQAVAGEIAAIREVIDRLEGKPRQSVAVDMSGMDWREQAREFGLSIDDIIAETRRLIDAAVTERDEEPDRQ